MYFLIKYFEFKNFQKSWKGSSFGPTISAVLSSDVNSQKILEDVDQLEGFNNTSKISIGTLSLLQLISSTQKFPIDAKK